MNKSNKLYTIALTVVITAALSVITTTAYYNGRLFVSPSDFDKFGAVRRVLDEFYYEEYDKKVAEEGAIRGYVNALGDPYTTYMDKKEVEDFYAIINSSYCGIGVTVQNNTQDNVIEIIDIFDNSPAKESGIQVGDVLCKVDGVDYTGEQMEQATSAIKGEEGTVVKVTVIKKDTGKQVEYSVTRRSIEVDSVGSEIVEGNIGYIGIAQFATTTGAEFSKHLQDLLDKGIKGLVIDVRDNGGGITDAVESVVDNLIEKGLVIYYTSDKNGKKVYAYSKKDPMTDVPVVVLANKNSASASEILIAALKEHKRAKIVGEKSYGKGVVQQLIGMADGSAVKITVEKYFTPNGVDIHKKGISPDYTVVLDENSKTDTQLEKAIELLK